MNILMGVVHFFGVANIVKMSVDAYEAGHAWGSVLLLVVASVLNCIMTKGWYHGGVADGLAKSLNIFKESFGRK